MDGISATACTEETRTFRDAVRRFADAELVPVSETLDTPDPLPPEMRALLARNGYLGATIPPEHGGAGISFRQYCIVLEEFSRAHSGFALAVTMTGGPFAQAILSAGSEAQRREILPGLCDGTLEPAFALTEPDAGSDAGAIRTAARRAPGGWLLNGRKHYITGGDTAGIVQVVAVTDPERRARGGMTSFLIRRGAPGLSVGRVDVSIGNDRLAELVFDDCFVADDMVLGEVGQGFRLALGGLDEGRLGVAASCNGAAGKLIELGVAHAALRKTFGTALADRQSVQWMLADSAVELRASRAMFEEALAGMEAGRSITTLASMSKLYASEMVGRVADRVMQIHGGAGVIRGVGVERMYRQTRHYRIGEGTSEIQRMIIARALFNGGGVV